MHLMTAALVTLLTGAAAAWRIPAPTMRAAEPITTQAIDAIKPAMTPAVDAAASAIQLRLFLERAGVHAKFMDRVLATCDEEMIGDVNALQIAAEYGLLDSIFKPVIARGIERELNDGSPAGASPPRGAQLAVAPGLETEPQRDLSHVPINTYKQKAPHIGSIRSVRRIVGASAPGEVCHVVVGMGGEYRYLEGQSVGVIPPGVSPKTGKPNTVRLYSIASTRYGDEPAAADSVSLCVRRATYWCPELNAEDPAKKGVCSNYLCDAKPGTEVAMVGPTGKAMLMPQHDPSADLIMVATGTGIAPYRGFIRRLFVEDTPASRSFDGLAWLFLGVANTDALLYDDDWQALAMAEPGRFRVDYALSREQTRPDGMKMYIQDRMAGYSDELFDRMDKGTRTAHSFRARLLTMHVMEARVLMYAFYCMLHRHWQALTCTSAASRG